MQRQLLSWLPELRVLNPRYAGVETPGFYTTLGDASSNQRLPGAEFLWRLLLHVLPKRFRRVRDFGLLHGNAKRLILLVQLVLSVRVPWPMPPREPTPMVCPRCGGALQLLMVRQREGIPILC